MAIRKRRKPRTRKPKKLTQKELFLLQCEREWETISEGLTPQEKRAKAAELRGVGVVPKIFHNRLRPPSSDDWRSLALHCARKIVEKGTSERSDRVSTRIRLPFNYKKAGSRIPTGLLVDADMFTLTFETNANKLLDYVWNLGHTDFNSATLRKYLRGINRELNMFEKDPEFWVINNYGIDSEIFAHWESLVDGFEKENEV